AWRLMGCTGSVWRLYHGGRPISPSVRMQFAVRGVTRYTMRPGRRWHGWRRRVAPDERQGVLSMMIFFDIGDTLVDESDFARFRHASVFTFLAPRGIATSDEQST